MGREMVTGARNMDCPADERLTRLMVTYPHAQAAQVLKFFREFSRTAPIS
jgi:hypothetical protein